MSEKVRGALFNTLGDVTGLTVLDAFSGSGALSFEALSRGAAAVTAIDIDKSAITTIVKNSGVLGLKNRLKAIKASVSGWSDNNPDARFDLVFCDPPYDAINKVLLERIASHVKPGGIVVFSLPPNNGFLLSSAYEPLTTKSYGDAELIFYRRAV